MMQIQQAWYLTIIVIFFLSKAQNNLYAQYQDSLRKVYTNQTITRYGYSFLKGSEKLNYKDLANELKSSELAMISFNQAHKHKITATVYRLLSGASLVAALSVIRSNRNLAWGFIGGNVVFTLFGARHNTQYQQQLDRALWQYNKDVLFPEVQR